MENKIPESLLDLYESLLSAQLRVVKQLKNPKSTKTKREGEKGMSNMDMAIDILRKARQPLHISEILRPNQNPIQNQPGPGIPGQRPGQKGPPPPGSGPNRPQHLRGDGQVRPKKARHPPNQERILDDDLLRKLLQLLWLYRGMIRITLLRNIALVTHALLTLFHGARGANGWLSQAALARCLPLESSPKGQGTAAFPVSG